MTPYKSRPTGRGDSIEAQERFTPSHSPPLQRMVGYDGGHLFASVRSYLVARYAWRLATSSPACALLAACHASAVSRAANVGRPRPLDAGCAHGVALGRVLKAAYGDVHLLVAWWVAEALQPLPPPKDGPLHLVGDGSVTPKRGTQHPLAPKGRKSAPQPWVVGLRFARLMATWDV
jgi:hypothetical protein